jgi:sensor histidine kinase regulating citrate/malate metabolism
MIENLLNKKHTFPDGDSLEVIQLKLRDEGEYWVTYLTRQGPGIPRKLTMSYTEFMDAYGHLFDA